MKEERFDRLVEAYNTMQLATALCGIAGYHPTLWTRIRMSLLEALISLEAYRGNYRIQWSASYYTAKSGAPYKAYYVIRPMRTVELDADS